MLKRLRSPARLVFPLASFLFLLTLREPSIYFKELAFEKNFQL